MEEGNMKRGLLRIPTNLDTRVSRESICGLKQECGNWKRSYFNGSGSAKNMPLPLPDHSKKHTVNYVLDIRFTSIY